MSFNRKIPWTRQPQYPVDYDLSIVRGPAIIRVSPPFASITRDVAAYQNALSYKFVKASAQYNNLAFADTTFPNGYTFIAVIAPTGTDSSYSNVFNIGGGIFRHFQLRHDTTTWYLYQNTNGTDWASVTWPYIANKPTVIAGRWDGATVSVYESGVLRGTIARGAFTTSANTIRIGGNADNSEGLVPGSYWDGGIGNFTLFDYDVGHLGTLSLSNNPWQIFRPLKRRIFVASAGGVFSQSVDGTLSFFGTSIKRISKINAGSITPIGSAAKNTGRIISGTLSFSGIISTLKSFFRAFIGSLSFSAQPVKLTSKSHSGVLSFSGIVRKITWRILSGAVGFSSSVTSIKAYLRSVSGSMSFSGAIQKAPGKSINGAISFSGASQKAINKFTAGALSFSGVIMKSINKLFLGVISFAGSVSSIKAYLRSLAGSLSFSGQAKKSTSKIALGALAFSSSLSKITAKILFGAVSFASTLTALISGFIATLTSRRRALKAKKDGRILTAKRDNRMMKAK